jgi:hypothetical protein
MIPFIGRLRLMRFLSISSIMITSSSINSSLLVMIELQQVFLTPSRMAYYLQYVYSVSQPPLFTSPSNLRAMALQTFPLTISHASLSIRSYRI